MLYLTPGELNAYFNKNLEKILFLLKKLKCCGISSPNDWENNPYYKCSSISTYACSVPASCCYNFAIDKPKFNLFCGLNVRRNDSIAKSYQLIHVTGCKYSIYTFLDYKHKLASFILAGVLVPQVSLTPSF